MKSLIGSASTVFYDADRNGSELQQIVPALYNALERGQVRSLRESLHLMRCVHMKEVSGTSAHYSVLSTCNGGPTTQTERFLWLQVGQITSRG